MRWLLVLSCLVRSVSAEPALEGFVGEKALKTASVGVCLLPLDGSEGAMAWQADTALIPASTMKAVTTATALQRLGMEYLFETKLYLNGADLVVKGGGDPTFGAAGVAAEFPAWVNVLKDAGISEIKGDIVADPSRFESQTTPNDWPWGDVGNYYGAGPSGLNYHLNSFALTFRPAGVGERAALVSTWPTPPGVEFANDLRTGPVGSGDQGYAYGGPGATRISMRGTIPAGGDFLIKGALPDPPMSCAVSLRNFLLANGIKVYGEAWVASPDLKNSRLLHTQKSPTLAEIITATNHRSVNLYADSLFKALSEDGSTSSSAAILRKHWEEQGVDLTGFVLHDGSGLSPRNSVTARQMAMILVKARAHETGDIFLESLPRIGKFRVKPGGMTRVSTYVGFLTADSGREFAFAVLVNNAVANPRGAIMSLLDGMAKSR